MRKQQGCCCWEWCLGRVIIGLFFVIMGLLQIQAWQAGLELLKIKEMLYPDVALGIFIGAEVIFGLLIVMGVFQRVAAWVLIVITLIAVPTFLHFWDMAAGPAREAMFIRFLGDIAILGGLLLLAGHHSKK